MLLEELEPDTEVQIEYKIFCDLDGVLADFARGIKKLIPDYSEKQYLEDPKYRSKQWDLITQYGKDGGKFWGELEVTPDAHQLWNYIKRHNPDVLTATGNPKYGAAEQKLEWFPHNFGTGTEIRFVRMSKEKAQFAAPTHILIDDMAKSIDPWIAAGGIGILHTSAAVTISELKKLGL